MRPTTVQIIVLVLIILLLFGARRLPELARSVGQSLKIFKSEVKDLNDDNDKPRAVEGRRDDTTTQAPTADGATPAVSEYPARNRSGEQRAADGDRGPTA
ncbi:twin-arginine translocase TatA/TatE family subunit [Actinotalea sp. Marseille-Q4924]|uniref:twin-arginine translocase TatA/TatE family subunit n=1 Tax=Actinotalea sp. Marseille-Q4924 TaxID=2866571 RepID=UPI001CE4B53F|nr:twin-arginine translocase TatA/TatE family subunit [Actinotalea sp. Marseille-Q4924]